MRMISQQASVNIASANYYFGGKEGLWKAVMMKYAPQARDFRISMMNEAMEKGTVRRWPTPMFTLPSTASCM